MIAPNVDPHNLLTVRTDGSASSGLRFTALDSGSTLVIVPGEAGSWEAETFRVAYTSLADESNPFDAPYLFAVSVTPPPELAAEFRRWLHEEHFDRQVATPGLHWGAGLESVSLPLRFLNLWGLDDPGVPESEEYLRIRATPRFDAVAHVFSASHVERTVYRQIGRAGG